MKGGPFIYNKAYKIFGLRHRSNVTNNYTEDPPKKTTKSNDTDSRQEYVPSTKNLDITSLYKKQLSLQHQYIYNYRKEMNNSCYGSNDVNKL